MPNNTMPKNPKAEATFQDFVVSMNTSGVFDMDDIREQAKTRGIAVAAAAGVKDPENNLTPSDESATPKVTTGDDKDTQKK